LGCNGEMFTAPPQALTVDAAVIPPLTLGSVKRISVPSGHEGTAADGSGFHDIRKDALPTLGANETVLTASAFWPDTLPSVGWVASGPKAPMMSGTGYPFNEHRDDEVLKTENWAAYPVAVMLPPDCVMVSWDLVQVGPACAAGNGAVVVVLSGTEPAGRDSPESVPEDVGVELAAPVVEVDDFEAWEVVVAAGSAAVWW
jgi:hypothetical protein